MKGGPLLVEATNEQHPNASSDMAGGSSSLRYVIVKPL